MSASAGAGEAGVEPRGKSAAARPGRSLCFAHDPELKAKREAARLNGGLNKRTSRRLDKMSTQSLAKRVERVVGSSVMSAIAGRLQMLEDRARRLHMGEVVTWLKAASEAELAALNEQHWAGLPPGERERTTAWIEGLSDGELARLVAEGIR